MAPETVETWLLYAMDLYDTGQALFEARLEGIHPFCVTIDEEGADYVPHMCGAANFVAIDDIAKLPLNLSDLYRGLTS